VEQFKRQPPERSEAWIYIDSDERPETVPPVEALPPCVLRVVEHLLPVSVELGQPFRLRCLIEADPEPEVTWYRNGQEVNQIKGDRAM
jgi:Immunoglobulin domain